MGSSIASSSNFSGILSNNNRLIFKYPDGSYSYAYKCATNDLQKAGLDVSCKNSIDQEKRDYCEPRDTWL